MCSKPRGARGIEPETFRRRGQLLSCPPTTGPSVHFQLSNRCAYYIIYSGACLLCSVFDKVRGCASRFGMISFSAELCCATCLRQSPEDAELFGSPPRNALCKPCAPAGSTHAGMHQGKLTLMHTCVSTALRVLQCPLLIASVSNHQVLRRSQANSTIVSKLHLAQSDVKAHINRIPSQCISCSPPILSEKAVNISYELTCHDALPFATNLLWQRHICYRNEPCLLSSWKRRQQYTAYT